MTHNSVTNNPADEPRTLAAAARGLVAASRRGILSTIMPDGGYPYGSLVNLAPMGDGDLIMLLSSLAEHQQFLTADPRASVHIAPSMMEDDALARPRVTLVGRVQSVAERASLADLYLEYHPQARRYVAFADFSFYRLSVDRVRYIAGFGQMGWIDGSIYRAAVPGTT